MEHSEKGSHWEVESDMKWKNRFHILSLKPFNNPCIMQMNHSFLEWIVILKFFWLLLSSFSFNSLFSPQSPNCFSLQKWFFGPHLEELIWFFLWVPSLVVIHLFNEGECEEWGEVGFNFFLLDTLLFSSDSNSFFKVITNFLYDSLSFDSEVDNWI